jgi:hypothetical protein
LREARAFLNGRTLEISERVRKSRERNTTGALRGEQSACRRDSGRSAIFGANAVKDMTTEWATHGKVRMIEVIGRVATHAEAFHYAARTQIRGHSKGHDLR